MTPYIITWAFIAAFCAVWNQWPLRKVAPNWARGFLSVILGFVTLFAIGAIALLIEPDLASPASAPTSRPTIAPTVEAQTAALLTSSALYVIPSTLIIRSGPGNEFQALAKLMGCDLVGEEALITNGWIQVSVGIVNAGGYRGYVPAVSVSSNKSACNAQTDPGPWVRLDLTQTP